MPSYNNFKNALKRSTEQDDVFKNPKQMFKETEISGKRKDNIIDWITFYRRNMHRFVEHYFGIKLHPYQIFWIYWMSISDSFVAICSRALGKTWLVSVFACAKAVLYPMSEIVVVSSTKEQSGNLIDKIISLKDEHPNLQREISNVVTNMNKWQVDFHNGSIIKVVASRDSSRGKRASFICYEEFRLINKAVVDSIIRPFAYIRQAPFLQFPEYVHLAEEPKEVFISSAYHKGSGGEYWWFEETKKNIKAMMKGDNAGFIAADLSLAIRHHIKTKRQIKNELSKMDEVSALEEYWNIPWGESSSSYYKLKMFDRARRIDKAFYPQRIETYNPKKNPYTIVKSDGEIRLLACDLAQRSGPKNDLSITACIRLLPTHKGYARELVYLEAFSGINSIQQSLRIKQVFHDFDADIIVMDIGAGGGGGPMYDQLGQITRDTERGIEYEAMTILPHFSIDSSVYDELSKRTLGINARQCIYPISGTSKLNSIIAVSLRDSLQKKMWSFLKDEVSAEDYLIKSYYSKEFLDDKDIVAKSFFLAPYLNTSLMINETINLSMTMSSGNLKLVEPPGGRKDRWSSFAMGNYYASLLDLELLREEEVGDDYWYVSSLIQSI